MKEVFSYFLLLLAISESFSSSEIYEDHEASELAPSTLAHHSQLRRMLLTKNKLFVDKSMFISALINSTRDTDIILRPPKWGKSFNLEMTELFFDIRYDENGTSKPWPVRDTFFKGGLTQYKISDKEVNINRKPLEISKYATAMNEMGLHPVLFLSFNGFDGSYENFRKSTIKAIGDIIIKKKYTFLIKYCKEVFTYDKFCKRLLENPRKSLEDDYILEHSFYFLSRLLEKHSGRGVVVLIDDYDYPLNAMIGKENDLSRVSKFQYNFFSTTFKEGEYPPYKFIISGSLQNFWWKFLHPGASAGVHLVKLHTIADKKYSSYFGFTKQEIEEILDKGGYSADIKDMEKWYGGYRASGNKMLNPYSVSRCLAEGGTYQAHWLRNEATGLVEEYSPIDKLLNELLLEDYRQKLLQELCYRHSSETKLIKNVNFKTKLFYDEFASILTFLGYLTISRIKENTYEVIIPNHQIRDFTLLTFKHWILSKNSMKQTRELQNRLEDIMMNLGKGNVRAIERLFSEILPELDIAENTHCEMIFALLHYSPIPWKLNRTFTEYFGSKWDCIITLTPPENSGLRAGFVTVGPNQMTSREWIGNFREQLKKDEWPFLNQFLAKEANITIQRIIYHVSRFVRIAYEGSTDLKIRGSISITRKKAFVGVYLVEKYKKRGNPVKKFLKFILRRNKESSQNLVDTNGQWGNTDDESFVSL